MLRLEMAGWGGLLHAFWTPWPPKITRHGDTDSDTSMACLNSTLQKMGRRKLLKIGWRFDH